MKNIRHYAFVAIVALSFAVPVFAQDIRDIARRIGIPLYAVEIIGEFAHDSTSFTQGLEIADGILYESTGLYGESKLRKLDPKTGEVLTGVALPAGFFGEGITLIGGKVYQLTWQEHTAFVYDAATLNLLETWAYNEDGWGLAHDGTSFLMTDGSTNVMLRATGDFTLLKSVPVVFGRGQIGNLNELEYVDGTLYANVLGADVILEINPTTGETIGVIDCAPLRSEVGGEIPDKPLNGIAYDSTSGEFIVTGKLWPKMFRVKFVRNLSGQ